MQFIKPMLAKPSSLPEKDSDYGYEIKWDGLRAIVYIQSGKLTVASRGLHDITKQYPELQPLGTSFPEKFSAVFDGEIIALDANGKPSFALLQHRMGLSALAVINERSQQTPITFIIFDLLYLNSISLLDLPYVERRSRLEALEASGSNWQTPPYQVGRGADFFQSMCDMKLEGLVAKCLDSHYYPGQRTGDWLKVKNQLRQEFVIGGWIAGEGTRSGRIGALLVGYYHPTSDDKSTSLYYAGKVGTGFSTAMLDRLANLLEPLRRDDSPFKPDQSVPQANYVEPLLVGEVEFTEWTRHNTLRHPSFKGLRSDKDPHKVFREYYH